MENNFNEDLVNFMLKIKNAVDFLARGYFIENADEKHAVEIVTNSDVMARQAFSLCEYCIYDELETHYYGEQKSIGILIEYIEDGEYERQIEPEVDFSIPYTPEPENAKFYNMVMSRINYILKMMGLSLISGARIPLDKIEFAELKRVFLDEEEISFYEENDIDIDGFLIYNIKSGLFCAVNSEGQAIIEDIDVSVGLDFYNKYLMKREEEVLYDMAIEDTINNKEKGRESTDKSFSEDERE